MTYLIRLCISQSLTIVRRHPPTLHDVRGRLHGRSDVETARIDDVIDGIKDARGAIVSFPFVDNKQKVCSQHFGALQRFFPCFEAIIAANSASPPFAIGNAITIADVLLAELVESTMEAFASTFGASAADEVLKPFPRLHALHSYVIALPAIVKFKQSDNYMPFPAGEVGIAYVHNVRTVMN